MKGTENKKEKKPLNISFREIGLPKLILMLAAGIVLILLSVPDLIPQSQPKSNNAPENQQSLRTEKEEGNEDYTVKLEKKLERVLARVKGVGKVEVMITLSSSKEKVTLKDSPYNLESTTETDSSGGNRIQNKESKEEQSVLVEEENSSLPYVLKEIEPTVEGIVVVAEGGDDIILQNEIINAVEVLFKVEKHKIKVMKMEFE